METETREQAICFFGNELAKRTKLPIAGRCFCKGKNNEHLCTGCSSVIDGHRHVANKMTVFQNPAKDGKLSQNPYAYYLIVNESCAPAGRNMIGLEITTPVRGTKEIIAKLPEIQQIVGTLSRMDCKIQCGDSTGLHVHVGADKLSLRLAQKVTTLVAILELPFLQAMQPLSRRKSRFDHASPIVVDSLIIRKPALLGETWKLRAAYKAEKKLVEAHVPRETLKGNPFWDVRGKEISKLIHFVWTAKTLPKLQEALCRNGKERLGLALALRGDAPHENSASTVEFRYSSMTFHTAYIYVWIRIVTRIVEISRMDTAAYATKVRAIMLSLQRWTEGAPEMCFANLLRALGFVDDAQVKEWTSLMKHHRNGVDPSLDKDNRLVRIPK